MSSYETEGGKMLVNETAIAEAGLDSEGGMIVLTQQEDNER